MSAGGGQGEPARGPSNLQLRVMSAVVLIAVALAATWAGGIWFRLLAAIIGAAVFFEWAAMASDRASVRHRAGTGALAAVPLLMIVAGSPAWMVFAAIGGGVLMTLGIAILLGDRGALWLALGYATAPAAALALLRGSDAAGLVAILFLFAVVWATDIAAYFVGRAVGGPKLAPSISPGKTISGAVGGAAAGFAAGAGVAVWSGTGAGWVLPAVLAIGLSVVSQAGDLFESAVKRRFGVKDSGRLIPGHGGVMDRVDALVAAALALYLVGAFAGAADAPSATLFGR